MSTPGCPRCSGLVLGPDWEYPLSGKVYTVHCANCGWRIYTSWKHQERLEANQKKKQVLRSGNKTVTYNPKTNKVSRVRNLTDYKF